MGGSVLNTLGLSREIHTYLANHRRFNSGLYQAGLNQTMPGAGSSARDWQEYYNRLAGVVAVSDVSSGGTSMAYDCLAHSNSYRMTDEQEAALADRVINLFESEPQKWVWRNEFARMANSSRGLEVSCSEGRTFVIPEGEALVNFHMREHIDRLATAMHDLRHNPKFPDPVNRLIASLPESKTKTTDFVPEVSEETMDGLRKAARVPTKVKAVMVCGALGILVGTAPVWFSAVARAAGL